jgi:anaerobic selenocysteine-containing dehydrogenase
MMRSGTSLDATAWHDVQPKLRDRLQEAGGGPNGAVRVLVSAHASTEELFVLKQMVQGLLGNDGLAAVSIAWTGGEKPQPPGTKFKIPPTDAPNVNGARDLGFAVGKGNEAPPDLAAFRAAIEGGRVKGLYVFDPGPDGSLGDVSWLIAARRGGTLPLLIVQGVLMTDLAAAADFVLPGAAYVEKDAIYTNDQGRVQAASRAE